MLKKKSLILIGFLIMAVFFGVLVFCVLGKGESYDFNLSRTNEILKEMLTKGISGAPYRIYSWDNAAYGSGEPLFYGDIFLYIPAFLSYLYFKISTAYKIYILIVLFASFTGVFFLIKRITGKVNIAFVSASGYSIIAFLLIVFIQGKYLGEYSFFAFIPLVISGIFSLIFREKSNADIIKISLGMAGMLFSQLVIAIAFGVLIIIFLIIKDKYKLIFVLLSFLFALGISSYYIFPMMEQIAQPEIKIGCVYPSDLCEDGYGINRGEVILSDSNDIRTYFKRSWTDVYVKFKKNHKNNAYLELPLIMYEGYVAIDNKTRQEFEIVSSKNGLVQININDIEEGELTVFYRGTEIQNYSVILSTVSFIVLIIFVYRKKGEKGCN